MSDPEVVAEMKKPENGYNGVEYVPLEWLLTKIQARYPGE